MAMSKPRPLLGAVKPKDETAAKTAAEIQGLKSAHVRPTLDTVPPPQRQRQMPAGGTGAACTEEVTLQTLAAEVRELKDLFKEFAACTEEVTLQTLAAEVRELKDLFKELKDSLLHFILRRT